MKITAEERDRGELSGERLAEAIRELRSHGYVTLEGCMPPSLVGELCTEYDAALARKIERFGISTVPADERRMRESPGVAIAFEPIGGNHDYNRWNMHLPSRMPFLDERLVANPIAVAVMRGVAGEDLVLKRVASDTAMPSAGYQNPHRDLHFDVDAVQIVANIPLVDMNEENGPLEIWPRTHLRNHDDPYEPFNQKPFPWTKEQMSGHVAQNPPDRVVVPAGTFILRDLRIMHRGSPHRGTRSRPMLSVAYRPPPTRVPHPVVADALARFTLFLREKARQPGAVDDRLLNKANGWGRYVEVTAGTDRDYRRRIPEEIWYGFSPTARALFRYAEVEGKPPARWSASLSAQLAAMALITVPRVALLMATHRGGTPAAKADAPRDD